MNKLPFKVSFADFTSGPPMLQAMGWARWTSVASATPRPSSRPPAAPITVVGALSNNADSAALLVPNGSRSPRSRSSRARRSPSPRAAPPTSPVWALKKAGLSPKDVTLEYLQPAEALAAFSSGSVDAWDVWSPFIEQAVAQSHGRIIRNGDGETANFSYLVASQSALEQCGDLQGDRDVPQDAQSGAPLGQQPPRRLGGHLGQGHRPAGERHDQGGQGRHPTPVPVDGTISAAEQSLVDAFSGVGLIPKTTRSRRTPAASSTHPSAILTRERSPP